MLRKIRKHLPRHAIDAKVEVLAHWREIGKWWEGEHEREHLRFLDGTGVVREISREYPCVIQPRVSQVCEKSHHKEAGTVDYEIFKREARSVKTELGLIKALELHHNKNGGVDRSREKRKSLLALHCLSAYSFGRSTLTPQKIAALAYSSGMKAVALTDYFSLAGAVEFCRAARDLGIKPIIGATVEMSTGGELVLLARNATGYANLCRLITRCHLDEPRMFPLCTWERLEAFSAGLICLTGGHFGPINFALMRRDRDTARKQMLTLLGIFGKDNLLLEIERSFAPWEIAVNRALIELSNELNLRIISGGAITHGFRREFPAQDALLSAETLCTVEQIIGRKPRRHKDQRQFGPVPLRFMNAERCFEAWTENHSEYPAADVFVAAEIADEMPDWPLPKRPSFPKFEDEPDCILRTVVWQGALKRYYDVTPRIRRRLDCELKRICDLGFSSHFLAIWEACRWAKSKGILYSARGSVVDSAVAYCLGLSRIDAIKHNLHFERFLPADGSKRPDIDIDFEAKRRDDVRNFFVRRYGREHVSGIAAIATYQGRGIVRMIGKALMIPEKVIDYLAKRLHGSVSGSNIEAALVSRPELRDSGVPKERFLLLFQIAEAIDGLPRQMAAHSSGLVLSATPICDTVPVMESGLPDAPIAQWDKYSAKHFFDKFDILCLRGQDVLAGAGRNIEQTLGSGYDVERIPVDDPDTFEVFRNGKLIGIPQSASPAMRQAHIRLGTENLHDASLVQAGIRPGVGGAVKINALIRRRRGVETYYFLHPLLEKILGISYGIIVFQEQVDQLLQAFCGYTSGEAEEIREKIHKLRSQDWGKTLRDQMVSRALERGFSMHVAEHVFELVSGFRGYGFAQGHALSFAEISIRCAYLQNKYPAEYFASLLSAQPAGYYGPGTIANEARIRNVSILPIDVNNSQELFSVEKNCFVVNHDRMYPLSEVSDYASNANVYPSNKRAIRIGLMQQFGLSKSTMARMLEERRRRPFCSFFDFCFRVRPKSDELECLILSGAFDSLHSNRRALLWALPDGVRLAQSKSSSKLFFEEDILGVIPGGVVDFSDYEKAVLERAMLGMDVEKHLMSFERERIKRKGGITCREASSLRHGEKAFVCGLAMRLRFPPTASGKRVVFFDLEDETGLLNVTCFDETYQRDGHAIICSPFVTVRGEGQERDGHSAFLAKRVFPYTFAADSSGFAQERKAVHAEDFIVNNGRS